MVSVIQPSYTFDSFLESISSLGLDCSYVFSTIPIGALMLTLIIWYYLFWKPFDWYQDFTDLGFDQIKKAHAHYGKATQRDVINRIQKLRNLGDLPPVYPNGWFAILESDELKCQTVKEVSALGQNLVAWRGSSGKAYVADAYCPHLGAHLGVGGKVSGECITCPFHGWEFQGSDGHLVKIPYSNSKPEFAKINMKTIFEENGFIYLWFHAEGDEPNWYPLVVPEIKSGEWVYKGRSEFRIACHVQDIPENGADKHHFNVVHKSAVLTGGTPENSLFSWSAVKHVWSTEWRPCDEKGKKHMATYIFSHRLKIFDIFSILKVNIKVVQTGPGIADFEYDTVFGRAVLLIMVTPLEPFVQKMTHRLYGSRTFLRPLAIGLLLIEAIQLSRDISIWNRKTFMKNPVLPKEDSSIRKFRIWFNQFYSDNSPRQYFSKIDSNENPLDF